MRVLLFLWAVFLTFPVFAQESNSPPPFSSVPEILQRGLTRAIKQAGQTRQEYIAMHLDFFHYASRDPNALDTTDLEIVGDNIKRDALKLQLFRISHYDIDKDGNITKEELLKSKRFGGKVCFPSCGELPKEDLKDTPEYEETLFLDSDKDGIITETEMQTLKPEYLDITKGTWREWKLMKAYLDIDPNKDGKLTTEELETEAGKVFDQYDRDQNGVLSMDELSPYVSRNSDYISDWDSLSTIRCKEKPKKKHHNFTCDTDRIPPPRQP